MKKSTFNCVLMMGASLASSLLCATPAVASTTVYDGYGALQMGYNYVYEGGEGDTSETNGGLQLDARGSVALPLTSQFGAQVDTDFQRSVLTNGLEQEKMKATDSTMAVHGFWRGEKGLVGALIQRTTTSTTESEFSGSTFYYGGEAQYYLGRFTLAAQAAYGSGDNAGDPGSHRGNYTVKLRYFPKDNLLLGLGVTYDVTHFNYIYDGYIDAYKNWIIGGNAEYRLPHSRFSVLGSLEYRSITEPSYYNGVDYRSHGYGARFMAGIKMNFGPKTLIERDRSGASLDPVRSPNTSNDPV